MGGRAVEVRIPDRHQRQQDRDVVPERGFAEVIVDNVCAGQQILEAATTDRDGDG